MKFCFFDLDGTLADTDADIRLAWKKAISDLGLECPDFDARFVSGPPFDEMARTLFPDDFSCIGGLNAIHDAGLRVPDDISVCGYDGIALSQILSPRLTTWKQNTGDLGALAASCLIDLIEHPKTALIDRRIVSGSLLEGETVSDLR